MVTSALIEQITHLSEEDRLGLIDVLWDSLGNATPRLTPAEKTMLDASLADLKAHPDTSRPFTELLDQVHERIFAAS